MTERFDRKIPTWLRRLLYWTFLTAYVLLAIIGAIGITWPQQNLTDWQWSMSRVAGTGAATGAAVCIASYLTHRWRWELWGVLVGAVSLSGYVLVVSTVAPLASRGLLLASLTLVALGLYVRFFDCIARTHRWATAREAGRRYDQIHGS